MIAQHSKTLSRRAAAARLGMTPYNFVKLGLRGVVRVVAEPGTPIRYLEEDVERVRAEQEAAK